MGSLLVVFLSVTSLRRSRSQMKSDWENHSLRGQHASLAAFLRALSTISAGKQLCTALYIISTVQILVRYTATLRCGRRAGPRFKSETYAYCTHLSEKGNNPCSTPLRTCHSAEAEVTRHMSVAGVYRKPLTLIYFSWQRQYCINHLLINYVHITRPYVY